MSRAKAPPRVKGPYSERAGTRFRIRIYDTVGHRDVYFTTRPEALAGMRQAARDLPKGSEGRWLGAILDEYIKEKVQSGLCNPRSGQEDLGRLRFWLTDYLEEDIGKVTPKRAASLYERLVGKPRRRTGQPPTAATHRCYLHRVKMLELDTPKQPSDPATLQAEQLLSSLSPETLATLLELATRASAPKPPLMSSLSCGNLPCVLTAEAVATVRCARQSSGPFFFGLMAPKATTSGWPRAFRLHGLSFVACATRPMGIFLIAHAPCAARGFPCAAAAALGALLATLGISITPILTTVGMGGLAVALGLQDTLANLFAGVQIALAGNIRVGDYVRLQSNEEGYVDDIRWRAIRIRTLLNNCVLIPNNSRAHSTVTNYHLPARDLAVLIEVGVHYSSDLDRVERACSTLRHRGNRHSLSHPRHPSRPGARSPAAGTGGSGSSTNLRPPLRQREGSRAPDS